jgi:cytosine/adenosine deaminase-related metal-dependent hydrolase
MAHPDECEECRALAQELRDAYEDAWASSDQPTRDAWRATYKMIGGTEEDVQRAEKLLEALAREERYSARIPPGFFPRFPKCSNTCRKMAVHFARTGHNVRVRFRPTD